MTANAGNTTTEVKISWHVAIDMDDPSPKALDYIQNVLMIFNNIVKQALRNKKYEQVGRLPKFFLAQDKINIDRHNLWAWPGYEVGVKLSTQGIFFNVDSCTKFINKTTVQQQCEDMSYDGFSDKEIAAKFDSSNTE